MVPGFLRVLELSEKDSAQPTVGLSCASGPASGQWEPKPADGVPNLKKIITIIITPFPAFVFFLKT